MKTDDKKIKALVFDLGGVLIDLDLEKCRKAFADNLSFKDADSFLDASHQKGIYSELEEGLITPEEFRRIILKSSAPGSTDGDVDRSVWALLTRMDSYKPELLSELGKDYDLYLLSNNNPISMEKSRRIFSESGYPLDTLFKRLFLSYEMKMQKPSEKMFRTVVEEIGCPAGSILFIDDSAANVETAEKVGMNAVLYVQGTDLAKVLKNRLEELEQC